MVFQFSYGLHWVLCTPLLMSNSIIISWTCEAHINFMEERTSSSKYSTTLKYAWHRHNKNPGISTALLIEHNLNITNQTVISLTACINTK